nr:hypothetical protein [Streptomyces sp. TLI_235]
MSVWWTRHGDDSLAQLAALLAYFGADPLDDPGTGELARTAAALAGEYRASTRGEPIRAAAALLQEAAGELQAADRFRGTLLPSPAATCAAPWPCWCGPAQPSRHLARPPADKVPVPGRPGSGPVPRPPLPGPPGSPRRAGVRTGC